MLEPDEADLILRAIERAREVHARRAEPLETEAPGPPAVLAAQGEAETAEAAGVSAETCWPSRADGAVKLAESFLAGDPVTGTGGERFQVMVHLDQEVLGPDDSLGRHPGGWHPRSRGNVAESGVRLRPLATGGDGEALNIGRRARSIPPAICRALMLRDRGPLAPTAIDTDSPESRHLRVAGGMYRDSAINMQHLKEGGSYGAAWTTGQAFQRKTNQSREL